MPAGIDPARWRRVRRAADAVRSLAVWTARDTLQDRVPSAAGGVAFFTLLSLPPALLVFLGGLGYVSDLLGPDVRDSVRDRIVEAASTFLTEETVRDAVLPFVDGFMGRGRSGLLSVGIVLTLWSASRATKAMIEAVVVAYDLEEQLRPGWKRRLIAYGLTLGGIAVAVVLLPVLVAGPRLGELVAEPLGLEDAFATAWRALYWPIVLAAGVAALTTFYHLALPWSTPWRRDLPGAGLAVIVWVLGGLGLRLYADIAIIGRESVVGPLGAPIVLLLWLYVTAFAVLLGGELNAEIEKRWPTIPIERPETASVPTPDDRSSGAGGRRS